MTERPADGAALVVAILRHGSDVLLSRRGPTDGSDGTDTDRWSIVGGRADTDPDEAVRTAIREQTGLAVGEEVTFVRAGEPLRLDAHGADSARERIVRPFLFECARRDIDPGGADADVDADADADADADVAFEWVSPVATVDREVVVDRSEIDGEGCALPLDLRAVYGRVAPTVETITADDEHGAAFLSVRALEVLRDRAASLLAVRQPDESASGPQPSRDAGAKVVADPSSSVLDAEWRELAALARRLLAARPSMAVLRNRVNRAMAAAAAVDAAGDGEPEPVERDVADGDAAVGAARVLSATRSGIDRALAADATAARNAAPRLGGTVSTLSRSGTVREALREGPPARVFVAESRPGREGIAVAEELAADDAVDAAVTVHTDAAAATVLADADVDRVVVGADTITPDGAVVNKTGTRGIALAAAHEGVPVSVVAATDKVSTRDEVTIESGASAAVYAGDASIAVRNPTFDVTPPALVDELVTERGAFDPADVDGIAAELRALADWDDR